MENRKLGLLTLGAFIAVGLFFAPSAHAYWSNTHEYLTSEAVKLHNATAGDNAITSNLRQYLYDGVKAEDSDPRYVNHFYDPINNEGLTGVVEGEASNVWVNDRSAQQSAKYALQTKTSLSSSAYEAISKFYPTSDFTWNTAIRYWINGDKEMAMETLGHVLHLIEDLGVPEHARNDAHPDGSEYEKYANKYSLSTPDKNFTFRLGDKKQIELGSLEAYFDSLSRYSNKYFYSPDSIGLSGGYEFPEPDYMTAEIQDDKKYYVKNTDDEGQQYYLSAHSSLVNIMTPYKWDISIKETLIKDSYWNLLSVRTVRTTAGVIDQFFRDVEKAKEDPSFLQEEKPNDGLFDTISTVSGQLWSGAKSVAVGVGSFFGSVFNSIGNGFASAGSFISGLFVNDNGLTDAGSVALGDDADEAINTSEETTETTKKSTTTKKDEEIAALKMQIEGLKKDALLQDKTVLQLEKTRTATSTVVEEVSVMDDVQIKQVSTPSCAYSSGVKEGVVPIVINEVAWMGGVRSAGDEWIELKNVSGSDVDVSGWQVVNKGGGIKIPLGKLKNPIIKPGQFILLERTDNNSAAGVTADLIYSGALGNTNDGSKLFNASCGVVDEVAVTSKWPAGNNDTKQTMERNSAGSGWHTSTMAGGTPKKENSAGVSYAPTGSSVSYGQGGDTVTPRAYPTLLIAEVQTASASSTADEFVKLYNPNDTAIDLTGWYVQKKTKTATDFSTFAKTDLFTGKTITGNGFFTIAHPSSTTVYDVASDYGIADDNTLVIKNPNGDVVDKLGWGSAGDCEATCATGPADGQSIKRKYIAGLFVDTNSNADDFALSALQTPTVLMEDATTTIQTPSSTSTIYWDGDAQSGTVYDLRTDAWVGQRVSFSTSVTIGTLELGYYNDRSSSLVDVAIFSISGVQKWTTALTVPRISYGGYVNYDFSTALNLTAGDYFIGSRLVMGAMGIRKGSGSNPCGVAVYTTGNIPSCDDGNDVSMRISKWVAPSSTATSTEQGGESGLTTATTTNATSTATTTPQFYPVVINEIMYDLPGADDGREWIEIYNVGTTTADLADWKFFENGTNHGLSVVQRASVLPAGQYAVIVASSTEFLKDNSGFNSTIIDSAFSLSNDGEQLALKNGTVDIDLVTYTATTSANGTGMSLQKFSDGWKSASSTPGGVNVLPVIVVIDPVATSTATTTTETATTTDTTTATTTASLPTQLIDTVKTPMGPVSAFYQSLAVGTAVNMNGFRVFAEGIAGRWQGGVCEFDLGTRKCAGNLLLAQVPADVDIVTGVEKTPLTFTFASPVALDVNKQYALVVKPTGSVPISSRVASIYGASSDVYVSGALYFIESGSSSGNAGIADMYFEMQ